MFKIFPMLFLLYCLLFLAQDIEAQNETHDIERLALPLKVAVFDPAGKIEEAILQIVREEISTVLVNRKDYTVLERQLINKVLEENKFQGEGLVDESQVSEIGKIMGADYVFISTITPLDDNYYLSFKMIEVATARIEKQFTGSTQNGVYDIMPATQFVMKRLLGENVTQQTKNVPARSGTVTTDVNSVTLQTVNDAHTTENITEDVNGFCEMVFVQGGTFTMGCMPDNDSDCKDNETTVGSFYIGKYEITQLQWGIVMGKKFKGDNLPVSKVDYNDVQVFIRKLNTMTGKKYRLPTSAEWEYAAKGGAKSEGYKFCGSNDMDAVAWHLYNAGNKKHPVGTKMANELGIHDMLGNVGEWCDARVYRGGSYGSKLYSVVKFFVCPREMHYSISTIGFRLAMDAQ